jgi:probable rRNA maturation factor
VGIEIANESGTAIHEASIVAAARFAMDRMGVSPLAELSVLLVGTGVMAELHQRWMDQPGPTDVMAFPMDEPDDGGLLAGGRPDSPVGGPALLGDIVLCPEVATEQAREAQHPVADELEMLCTHGILHLLGFDHADPDEHATMFGLQDRLLGAWRAGQAAGRERKAQDESG